MLFDLKKICAICLLGASTLFAGACLDGAVISDIQFEGLKHTKAPVVERELENKVGEPFSAEKFDREKSKLQDLDLFTEISVSCDFVQTKDVDGQSQKPSTGVLLKYSFSEIFRWIPAPAGKVTDRDGVMLGLALANLNVAGEDIRVEAQYRTSMKPFFENNEYALYASSPYLFGLALGWNFEFLRTDSWDDLRSFNDASWLLDLDLNWKLQQHLSILASGAYRYIEDGPGHLPEIGAGFAIDYRDAALDTRNGFYVEYSLTHVGMGSDGSSSAEGKNLGGENYWEVLTDARVFYSMGDFVTGANALFRYRPGHVERYDLFYHGGTNTFRGHDADSSRLGVNEALLNLEERFVLLERRAASVWGVNFFYGLQVVAGLDGSLLWDEGSPSWDGFEGAVYGGLHLVVPALDRIRLEVGYSPDHGEPVFFFGLFDRAICSRWRNR